MGQDFLDIQYCSDADYYSNASMENQYFAETLIHVLRARTHSDAVRVYTNLHKKFPMIWIIFNKKFLFFLPLKAIII